mgnify:CR=1 FL=1
MKPLTRARDWAETRLETRLETWLQGRATIYYTNRIDPRKPSPGYIAEICLPLGITLAITEKETQK